MGGSMRASPFGDFCRFYLVRSALPGVLPRHGQSGVVPAVPDVGAKVIAEFQGVMEAYRNRHGRSNARIPLRRVGVLNAIHAGPASDPEIPVERSPKPRFDVVTQMPFEGENRAFCSGVARRGRVWRKEVMVGGEKPPRPVGVHYPMPPAPRQASFRLEGPTVGTIIDQFG